jgi:hypothetical protein
LLLARSIVGDCTRNGTREHDEQHRTGEDVRPHRVAIGLCVDNVGEEDREEDGIDKQRERLIRHVKADPAPNLAFV